MHFGWSAAFSFMQFHAILSLVCDCCKFRIVKDDGLFFPGHFVKVSVFCNDPLKTEGSLI